MSSKLIRLADWIDAMRHEIAHAAAVAASRSGRNGSDLVFQLQELTFEAEMVAEASDTTEGEVSFWVLKGNVGSETKSASSQRVSVKMSPVGDVWLGSGDAEHSLASLPPRKLNPTN